MKKLSTIIMALALVLSLSQCKKEETPNSNNTTPDVPEGMVYITVNVGDSNGGRHHIEPSVGAYIFTNGDLLYVGNNGHFVGTLEYQNGAFSGGIQSPSTNDYLHFYFLGGKTPATTPTAGTTTDFTISIADQSNNLPILSYGHSTAKYTDGNAAYSTTLRNKCALVKFDMALGTSDAVTVSNMLTTATVDFATPGITPTGATEAITLYSESETEKWAILLPGSNLGNATSTAGAISFAGGVAPEVANNGYINSGVEINNTPAPTVITWDETNVFNSSNQFVEVNKWNSSSATFAGITITFNGNGASSFMPYEWDAPEGPKAILMVFGNYGDSFTFTAPSGKQFTKIEIIDNGFLVFDEYGDWTQPEDNKIEWNGTAANEVTLGGNNSTFCNDLKSIVFTLVDAN